MPQLFRIVDLQIGPRENQCMNRYWLDNETATDLDAVDVGNEFFDQHIDLVRLVQSSEWQHSAVFVEDVLEPSNSVLITVVQGGGAINSDPVPASNAWSYALKPIGPVIKRGGKRIPGVSDAWADDEVVGSGTPTAAVEGLAASFFLPILVGAVELNPAVVRPIPLVNPTEYLVSVLAGAIYRQIGTQVSRLLSRGGGTNVSSLVPFQTANKTATDYSGYVETNAPTDIANAIATRPSATPYEVTRPIP